MLRPDVSPVAADPSRPELWAAGAAAPLFERLRREDPVHHCPESAFGPYWSVTRHRDVLHVEAQPELFSSSFLHGGITLFEDRQSLFPMFIAMDRPDHGPQRRTVAPAFAPSEMERLRADLVDRTRALVGGLPVDETFDWVERVSAELSTQMLAILFGFPWEERHRLARWAEWAGDSRAALDPVHARKRLEMLWECAGAFLRLSKQRQSEPGGADLLSMMSLSEATRDLSPQQFLGNLILLLVGGTDTTKSAMGALPMVNALWPEEWKKLLADPGLVPSAAQELVRWQTPLAHMRRTASADCELAGRPIRAGDKVVLWYFSANRDEALFDDGDRFIADRPNVRRHLGFGFGIHRCVGARLAGLQLSVLIEALLERGLRPVLAGEPERNPDCFLNGYKKLPVRLIRDSH